MFKKLIVAAGFILAGLSFANASSLVQISNATYELFRDGAPICSGQFVTPKEFLTAAHCLKNSEDHKYAVIEIKDNVVHSFALKVNHISPEYDTATLLIEDEDANFPTVDVQTFPFNPSIGDPVFIAAYPGVYGYLSFTQGVFNGEVPMPEGFLLSNGHTQYNVTVWAIPGSSGGGVYYKVGDEYFLIGMIHGGPNDFLNFTSTVEGIRNVL